MFLMWLGEQITERGLGNGISLIIFAGIAAGLPSAIGSTLELARTGAFSIRWCCYCSSGDSGHGFGGIVERGQRKILVNYAKRQVGNKVYGGQSSHLPLKLNMAARDTAYFCLRGIILFPATIAGWFGSGEGMGWLKISAGCCLPGSQFMC